MLSQVNHWMEFVGSAIDLILLLRVLSLRLYRTYLFITLSCLIAVFFDGVQVWLGESPEGVRLFFCSRFLFAFLFPLAAWEVFEEIKTPIANLRRLAITRTVTSLLTITILGLIFAGFAENGDDSTGLAFVSTLGMFVWTGSAAGSLAFLWVMRTGMKRQAVQPPHNTFVWLVYFGLSLLGEVLYAFIILVEQALPPLWRDVLYFVLALYGCVVTAWCVLKLRALPSDVSSAPVSESS